MISDGFAPACRALTPEMKERLDEIGAEPVGMAPAKFAAFIVSETAKWGKVTKDSGASID